MAEKESRLERRAKRKEDREALIKEQRSRFHQRQRNKRLVNYAILGVVVLAILWALYLYVSSKQVQGQNDQLAKCLTKNGAVMYGTDWCPHCQAQKRAFGDSFRYVTFINCDTNAEACNAAGVTGYPTWVFRDGTTKSGEQNLTFIAELGGCQE